MKLIQLKCPNCGNVFDYSEGIKEIKCQYCKTTVIIDNEVVKVEHSFINEDEKNLKVQRFI